MMQNSPTSNTKDTTANLFSLILQFRYAVNLQLQAIKKTSTHLNLQTLRDADTQTQAHTETQTHGHPIIQSNNRAHKRKPNSLATMQSGDVYVCSPRKGARPGGLVLVEQGRPSRWTVDVDAWTPGRLDASVRDRP